MGGKDRTGWTVASFLLLLGVSSEAVMADFLASNDFLMPTIGPFMEDFRALGGDPKLIADFMWARPEYLEAALDEMRGRFGTVEQYFLNGLGVGPGTLAALRAQFLEPG
jgi:protein-tyrosine phosphatase